MSLEEVKKKMHNGDVYFCDEQALIQTQCLEILHDYNHIPANVIAVGNPCRVLREIGSKDREFYFKDCKLDPELLESA